MKSEALGLAAVLATLAPAHAVNIDSSACLVIFDDKQRLECFDAAVKAVIEGRAPEAKVTPPPPAPVTPPTPLKAEAAADGDAKTIDPRDVQATPNKWQGRKLQFNRVNVYWVSDSDVRILTSENMTLFAKEVIGPPEAIRYFKRECETSREAFSQKCRAAVRFSYSRHSEDKPNGLYTRTVLISHDLEFVKPPQRRR